MPSSALSIPALLFVVAAFSTPVSAADQPDLLRLAVLPLESVNVEPAQREMLSGLLVERLNEATVFALVGADRLATQADDGGCARKPRCLQQLGKKLGDPRLLQLSVAGLGGTYVVRLTLFDARSGARTGSWQEVLDNLAPAKLGRSFDRMIAGFTPRPRAKPWYGRWWVWTVAAGVVAAGALTTVLLVTSSSDPGADVIITPP